MTPAEIACASLFLNYLLTDSGRCISLDYITGGEARTELVAQQRQIDGFPEWLVNLDMDTAKTFETGFAQPSHRRGAGAFSYANRYVRVLNENEMLRTLGIAFRWETVDCYTGAGYIHQLSQDGADQGPIPLSNINRSTRQKDCTALKITPRF